MWHSGVSGDGTDPLTLLDHEDAMSPEDESIGMIISDGFFLRKSRPATLDSSLVEREVLVRQITRWFGDMITRQSQERTKQVCD